MASDDEAQLSEVTRLLRAWSQGEREALDWLMPLVYHELRRTAQGYLRSERAGHTLQPTALVHEAWLRLNRQTGLDFSHRKQFFGLVAQVMRRVLVDHARATKAAKRDSARAEHTFVATATSPDRVVEILALDDALDQLSRLNPRQARVIELRYFGGLNLNEMAELLGVSSSTISRDQQVAEAWLGHTLGS